MTGFSKRLGGMSQDSLDEPRMLRMAQRRVDEQRPDRGEAEVARPRPIAAFGFEMVQEGTDHLRVEVVPPEGAGRLSGPFVHEDDEQLERVPIRGDRARAGVPLAGQAVDEEALQGRSDEAHREITPRDSSRRPAARESSSGAADRYQYVERGSRWPR